MIVPRYISKSIWLLMFLWVFVQEANALCVKAPKANLRSGPGTKYQKLWQVFKYMPFKRLKRKGNWIQVKDVDGDRYWIYKGLVTSSYKCAVVKKEKVNLRKGPGTNYKVVSWSPVSKYFSMKVVRTKGNWVKIVDSVGDKAWVYRPLIWIQ